jgi:hypothetical protein
MKKLISGTFRWLFKSAPGVALLVIAAGVGGAYAANSGGTDQATQAPRGGPGVSVAFGAPDQNLSDADRKSLEAFGQCMRENAPQPGDGTQPPDPAEGKAKFDAAFDKCKSNLSDSLQQKFEQRQAQMDAYQSCLSDNGASPPSPGNPPSKSDLETLQKAQKACADKLPDGAGTALCVGGGPGGPGRPGGPPGPGFGEFTMPAPPPSGKSN